MTAQPKPQITEAAYLEHERVSPIKHEYCAGQIFALAGASEAHNLIASNVHASLYAQLRGRGCRIYPSDMRIKVLKTGLYTYPDLSIVCGKPEFTNMAKRDTLITPTLIIEILSPSTERYDRGVKSQNYRAIEALKAYILIAQDTIEQKSPCHPCHAERSEASRCASSSPGRFAPLSVTGRVLRYCPKTLVTLSNIHAMNPTSGS